MLTERTILIVDDSDVMREMAIIALEGAGWEATSVGSGAEAVSAATARRPDAVLLDVEMPEMDGPATLAALRRDHETTHIPVVFLTGHDEPAVLERLVALGAAAALLKPFSVALLAGEISDALGWTR